MLPFAQPALPWLAPPQPAPSRCWTHWPTAFPSRRTELGVFGGGEGTNSGPSTTGVSLVGGICTEDVRGDIPVYP